MMNNELQIIQPSSNRDRSFGDISMSEHKFIDINIDSDSEYENRSASLTFLHAQKQQQQQHRNNESEQPSGQETASSVAENANGSSGKCALKEDKKFVFQKSLSISKFDANSQKVSVSSSHMNILGSTVPPPSSANLQSCSKSGSNTQMSHAAFARLNEAADILLSNLSEIRLNDFDSDDDDDDDDEEEDDDDDDDDDTDGEKRIEQRRSDKMRQFTTINSANINSTVLGLNDSLNMNHSTPLSSNSFSLNDISLVNSKLEENEEKEEGIHELPSENDTTLSLDHEEHNNENTLSDSNYESGLNINDNGVVCADNTKNSHKDKLITASGSPQKVACHRTNSLRNVTTAKRTDGAPAKIALRASNSLGLNYRNDSLVDGLLGDIYDRFNISFKDNFDSDVFTELSMSTSSRFSGGDSTAGQESESRFSSKFNRLHKFTQQQTNVAALRILVNEMSTKVNQMSAKLIRQLKQKDKLASKLNRNCDLLTAFLQARSEKRRVDTQMKFTLNPMPGEAGFIQWKDAMKALTRLPGGVPKEFRKSIWLNLAHKYIREINLDWNKVRRIAFNDRSNPDDDELGVQIVKDLHRTGCSAFSGHDNDQDRALLKRVLLAFARYNKSVGYCQGFNIIAALILEIVDRKEEDAFMCMIYLIDHVLPEGYFTNSMHSLAIDMAVFREILKLKLPKLCQHLNALQYSSVEPSSAAALTDKRARKSRDDAAASSSTDPASSLSKASTYEPPLTNVFTMQWFLTLFATCLRKNVLLRVWDCIFLEGSEILFRTSIAIWDKLSQSVINATSADAFYSMMSVLTIRLFDQNVLNENELIDKIYSYGPFPLAGLEDFREKFTFNITPFQVCMQQTTASGSSGSNNNNNKSSRSVRGARSAGEGLSHLKLSSNSSADAELELAGDEATHSQPPLIRLANGEEGGGVGGANDSDDLDLSLRKQLNSTGSISIDDDDEAEDLAKMISCFALLMPNRMSSASAIGAVASGSAPHLASSRSHSSTRVGAASSRNDIIMTAAAAVSAFGGMQPTVGKSSSFSNSSISPFSMLHRAFGLKSNANAARSSGWTETSQSAAQTNRLSSKTSSPSAASCGGDISMVTPGAFSFVSQMYNPKPLSEHLTLDINELKKQYRKLKERQRQAHIIIQTASSHNRLKMSNGSGSGSGGVGGGSSESGEVPLSTGGGDKFENSSSRRVSSVLTSGTCVANVTTHAAKSMFSSVPSPFMLEATPVVNHLLIKPSDPKCNTLKQSIQINNSLMQANASEMLTLNTRQSANKTIIDRFLSVSEEDKKTKKYKQPKTYYSDDDDNDDDDDDDDENDDDNLENEDTDTDTQEDNVANDDVYENALTGSRSLIELANQRRCSEPGVVDRNAQLNLIDLSIFENNKVDDLKTDASGNSSPTSSSSSSLSSPKVLKKESSNSIKKKAHFDEIRTPHLIIHDNTTTNAVSNDFELKSNDPSDTSFVNRKASTKESTLKTVINNLVNEEKIQHTPLFPFPARQINMNVAKNGIRLGLYK